MIPETQNGPFAPGEQVVIDPDLRIEVVWSYRNKYKIKRGDGLIVNRIRHRLIDGQNQWSISFQGKGDTFFDSFFFKKIPTPPV